MKKLLFLSLAFAASPLAAQNQDLGEPMAEGQDVETIEEDEGLSGSVSFEGNLDDLGIAIPAFATDRNAAYPDLAGLATFDRRFGMHGELTVRA